MRKINLTRRPGKKNASIAESGNVFLFILIGIVLFAAITYVMSRGSRSEGTSRLSARQAELAASEIISYGQKAARAFDRLRSRGCSESDISFYTTRAKTSAAVNNYYVNSNAPPDHSCDMFHANGADLEYYTEYPNYKSITTSDGSNAFVKTYQFFMRGQVVGIGNDNKNEGFMGISHVSEEFCKAYNRKVVGAETIYVARGPKSYLYSYNGTFNLDNINDSHAKIGTGVSAPLRGIRSACVQDTDDATLYSIYYVILER